MGEQFVVDIIRSGTWEEPISNKGSLAKEKPRWSTCSKASEVPQEGNGVGSTTSHFLDQDEHPEGQHCQGHARVTFASP
jgi:hypothetical protein